MFLQAGQQAGFASLQRKGRACPVRAQQVCGSVKQHVQDICTPIFKGRTRNSRASSVDCRAMLTTSPAVSGRISTRRQHAKQDLTVVIAGAGISGLTLALALLKQGIKVQVLERDLTAVRGEGKLRGPIQVQSNALAALEAIDPEVAQEIMRHGCITGDRINGLCDGVSGDWYVKFDCFHPAVDRGLPVTRVISRITLQQVLADAVLRYGGPDTIQGGCHVVGYEERQDQHGNKRVTAVLEGGRRVEGDLLVGTDGIWSKIRKQMLGDTPANYSEYTCYTGISDYVPADIDLVGYRVFLGNGQYFVSSDVGEGKMQWYAFHKEPAGGQDKPGQRKARLLQLFGHWNYNVVDLIKATPESDVLRRDIFDRAPVFTWAKGGVALMGDSAHAMQPNLGQGGCMAIEDAYELANDIAEAVVKADKKGSRVDVQGCLRHYTSQRMMRVSAIHGMAGMAAFMASTYKAYLGEGLGALSWITNYHIPHPGRVVGQQIMKLTMPAVLGWVLGGNTHHTEKSRPPHCKLEDKPHHFKESEFELFMHDDHAVAERCNADWLLVAERTVARAAQTVTSRVYESVAPMLQQAPQQPQQHLQRAAAAAGVHMMSSHASVMAMTVSDSQHLASSSVQEAIWERQAQRSTVEVVTTQHGLPAYEYKGTYLNLASEDGSTGRPTVLVGSGQDCHVLVADAHAAQHHAQVVQQARGKYLLQDLGSPQGTWVNGLRMERGSKREVYPGDVLEFGSHPSPEPFTVKLQHTSYRTSEVCGQQYQQINTGAMMSVA